MLFLCLFTRIVRSREGPRFWLPPNMTNMTTLKINVSFVPIIYMTDRYDKEDPPHSCCSLEASISLLHLH